MKKVRVGSVVMVQTWLDGLKRGTVDDVDYEGKNGRPTIGYVDAQGDGYWAYFDQITSVISY